MEPMFFFYLTFGAMLFLVLSLLLGHSHIGHGASNGHGWGHGSGPGHGAVHGADAGHSVPHGSSANGGEHVAQGPAGPGNMGVWSLQMLFLFVGGFGVGGYFAATARLALPLTLICGAFGGLVLASAGYFILNIFYRRQSDSNIYSEEFVGRTATVVTSIDAGSVGKVRCQIGANRETFLARSLDGEAIPINAVVRITDMVGSVAVVEVSGDDRESEPLWRR